MIVSTLSSALRMLAGIVFTVLLFALVNAEAAEPNDCPDFFASLGPPGKEHELGRDDEWWVLYDCNQCGRERVPSLPAAGVTRCLGCGHPRTTEVFYQAAVERGGHWFIDERMLVTPQHLETLAGAPEFKNVRTWTCASCSTPNFPAKASCLSCGTPKVVIDRVATDVPEAMMAAQELRRQSRQERTARREAARVNPKPVVDARGSHALSRAAVRPASGIRPLHILGGVSVVGAAGLGAWWAFSTHPVDGYVTKKKWRHSETIETFNLVTDRDWVADIREHDPVMPRNGVGEVAGAYDVRNCKYEHHHYEQYQCGTTTEHYTEYNSVYQGESCSPTINQSTGTSSMSCHSVYERVATPKTREVPKYCDRSIQMNRCDYSTYRWQA